MLNVLLDECNCIEPHLVYDVDAIRAMNATRELDVCRSKPVSSSKRDEDLLWLYNCTKFVHEKFDSETYKCDYCRVPCRYIVDQDDQTY